MPRRQPPRKKGKLSLSRFFQSFAKGDSVAIVQELSQIFGYKPTLQGRTGKILAKRGSAYEVAVKDGNKDKTYLLKPIHLKKLAVAQ
ncbi:50S ribosomal protein L21e [Candidatus Pacearchaeota archaeon]|nr:50S ribosomal protein L21e [Candidatus Pacearchaeota archaeon]